MLQGDPEYTFVEVMRRLRQQRGWSQERLAHEVERRGLKMNPTAITKLEWALDPEKVDKARGLRLREAVAIAAALESNAGAMASGDSEELEREETLRKAVEGVASAHERLAEINKQRALALAQVKAAEDRLSVHRAAWAARTKRPMLHAQSSGWSHSSP
jgi:hypothetical protein